MTTAVNVTRNPDAAWVIRAAGQTGIPERALRAYVAAAVTVNAAAPTCGIGWNTVAAVGSVETAHGTYGGGSLTAAGQVSRPVMGPVLDGARIRRHRRHGRGRSGRGYPLGPRCGTDAVHSFTWQLVGRDGNGDGTADPFNIDDAALSAATYLCSHGRDLTTADGWTDAIYAYNQSDAYIRQVREQATAYAAKTSAAG